MSSSWSPQQLPQQDAGSIDPYGPPAEYHGAQPLPYGTAAPAYGAQPPAYGTPAPPYEAPPYEAQPYSAQPYSAQPYSAQPYSAHPYGAQPYGAQPYGVQPYGARPNFGAQPGHYTVPRPTGTNGFATASIIFGIIGGTLLAVIFGHVALSQIKKTGQDGRGLAIVGIVLGYTWFVVALVMFFNALSAPVY